MTEDEAPPARCATCNVELVPGHLGGFRLMVGRLGARRRNAAEPRVCPKCGRVEFFSVEPGLFRVKPEK